jgi:hypothetical protein
MHHVEAAHFVEAGQEVGDGVDAEVAHVQATRGVREHGEDVLLVRAGLPVIIGAGSGGFAWMAVAMPFCLPFLVDRV